MSVAARRRQPGVGFYEEISEDCEKGGEEESQETLVVNEANGIYEVEREEGNQYFDSTSCFTSACNYNCREK